MDVRNQIKLT